MPMLRHSAASKQNGRVVPGLLEPQGFISINLGPKDLTLRGSEHFRGCEGLCTAYHENRGFRVIGSSSLQEAHPQRHEGKRRAAHLFPLPFAMLMP